MAHPDCSVVIPVYQEVQSVPTLHEALATVAGDLPDEVLRKVYHDNAVKILNPGTPVEER